MAMKRPWLFAVGALVGFTVFLDLIDLFVWHSGHPHSWWHRMPTFDGLFGFLGCALIVIVSKWLGYTWLQRSETYYGNE